MSQLVFRGNSYEKLQSSRQIYSTSHELIYRRRSSVGQRNNIIRSRKTALLLQLETSSYADSSFIYRGCRVSPQPSFNRIRKTIQPGGFIRSRMTAELIGVDPSPSLSVTVRPGGFLRSRPLAALLEVKVASAICKKRVYRGVQFNLPNL